MKWEYKFYLKMEDSKKELESIFNGLGKEGWEYCGETPSEHEKTNYFIFKRKA